MIMTVSRSACHMFGMTQVIIRAPTTRACACLTPTHPCLAAPRAHISLPKAYGQADFSSSVRLSRFLGEIPTDPETDLRCPELVNSKLRSYDQWVTATHNYYDPGQVIMFGVRGTW